MPVRQRLAWWIIQSHEDVHGRGRDGYRACVGLLSSVIVDGCCLQTPVGAVLWGDGILILLVSASVEFLYPCSLRVGLGVGRLV